MFNFYLRESKWACLTIHRRDVSLDYLGQCYFISLPPLAALKIFQFILIFSLFVMYPVIAFSFICSLRFTELFESLNLLFLPNLQNFNNYYFQKEKKSAELQRR